MLAQLGVSKTTLGLNFWVNENSKIRELVADIQINIILIIQCVADILLLYRHSYLFIGITAGCE